MTIRSLLLVALMVVGAVTGALGLTLLGVLALLVDFLATLWTQRGLARVIYERRLDRDRAVWGDEVELTTVVHNAKLLPLPWLRTDDRATIGLTIREQALLPSERPGLAELRNVWSLLPYQRLVRRFHIVANRRGLFHFETVTRRVADIFTRGEMSDEVSLPQSLLVRPRTVPVAARGPQRAELGTRRARHRLLEDPTLYAGVRPFQPADPRRRVHARASARLGLPVSKRYEPSSLRQVVVALDLRSVDEPYWVLHFNAELIESLVVAAASLVRQQLVDGAACGLAANGWSSSLAWTAFVPPRAGIGQLTSVLDVLGRLSLSPSAPFESVLAELPGRVSSGTQVLALSSRDPASFLSVLRRLARSGFTVSHLAIGPDARTWQRRMAMAGIESRVAHLEPDWRTAGILELVA
jgi:uncharacterized protein (DUF58 family)